MRGIPCQNRLAFGNLTPANAHNQMPSVEVEVPPDTRCPGAHNRTDVNRPGTPIDGACILAETIA